MHVKKMDFILKIAKKFLIPYYYCKTTAYYPNNQGVLPAISNFRLQVSGCRF
ncbi:hypothetical protein C8P67_1121 [Flavobacterium aquicola]|uniref:Uncharacterized protein n=1 Tax=Flavobacterium aquicola TaxID=1682742 RepID=A0A3E0E919_9FLAO|nr:hypothetical protein C8P67_1121 [Flavobacterium aquicola]